jgi:hypothetical protein
MNPPPSNPILTMALSAGAGHEKHKVAILVKKLFYNIDIQNDRQPSIRQPRICNLVLVTPIFTGFASAPRLVVRQEETGLVGPVSSSSVPPESNRLREGPSMKANLYRCEVRAMLVSSE